MHTYSWLALNQRCASVCRYIYPRHNEADGNIVPYHPACLLCWGAHMNIQAVTDTAWSFYVLKVGKPCKLQGCVASIGWCYSQ